MLRQAFLLLLWMMGLVLGVWISALQAREPSVARPPLPVQNLLRDFCLDCHSGVDATKTIRPPPPF